MRTKVSPFSIGGLEVKKQALEPTKENQRETML
jgi:hypothetical protein